MKHMVRNDEFKEKMFGYECSDLVILSCEFDNGKKVENADPVRLGNDGMEVWLMPCFSCSQQLRDYSIEAVLNAYSKLERRKTEQDKAVFYRDYVLTPVEGYEFPREDTEEFKDILLGVDKYVDKGESLGLLGIDIKRMARADLKK
jgi:hypothetical protein